MAARPQAIDEARQRVAAAVNAHPTEVIFTSGGSEANNLFLKGAAANLAGLIAATEHPCVLKPAQQLEKQGWRVRTLAVDGWADRSGGLRRGHAGQAEVAFSDAGQ
jgi:cysteine desulfurase